MIDTKLLEAWCHWVELETLDEISEDRKLMANNIRAVLAELKSTREVAEAARMVDSNGYVDARSAGTLLKLREALQNLDESRRGE